MRGAGAARGGHREVGRYNNSLDALGCLAARGFYDLGLTILPCRVPNAHLSLRAMTLSRTGVFADPRAERCHFPNLTDRKKAGVSHHWTNLPSKHAPTVECR